MKHKRDDGAEKHDDETVDVTPIMICVFVVMCCSMLVLLYFFYDHLGTRTVVFVLIHLNISRLLLFRERFYCENNDEKSVFCRVPSSQCDIKPSEYIATPAFSEGGLGGNRASFEH